MNLSFKSIKATFKDTTVGFLGTSFTISLSTVLPILADGFALAPGIIAGVSLLGMIITTSIKSTESKSYQSRTLNKLDEIGSKFFESQILNKLDEIENKSSFRYRIILYMLIIIIANMYSPTVINILSHTIYLMVAGAIVLAIIVLIIEFKVSYRRNKYRTEILESIKEETIEREEEIKRLKEEIKKQKLRKFHIRTFASSASEFHSRWRR